MWVAYLLGSLLIVAGLIDFGVSWSKDETEVNQRRADRSVDGLKRQLKQVSTKLAECQVLFDELPLTARTQVASVFERAVANRDTVALLLVEGVTPERLVEARQLIESMSLDTDYLKDICTFGATVDSLPRVLGR